jgi:predicted XRE-type DNA-binding protein
MTGSLETCVGSDNVFRDLGFPEGEAQNLLLGGNLVIHIRKEIDKLGITQVDAARRASITQPRTNNLVKGRIHKSMLDALVNVAATLGYCMQLKLKKAA